MRRRALLSATAVAISTPLVAGCSRDDDGGGGSGGGDGEGDGGGGGPYGDIDQAEPQVAVGQVDGAGAGPDGSDDGATGSHGPALGPEPGGG